MEKRKLEKQMDFMQKNPSAKVCFTQVELIDENGKTLTNRNRNYSVFITADRKTGKNGSAFFSSLWAIHCFRHFYLKRIAGYSWWV